MIEELATRILTRFAELESELGDPNVIGDRERYEAASRAYRELEPAAKLAEEYRLAVDDAAGARELLADGEDPELRALLDASRERMETLEEEIRLAMVERDPNDDKNIRHVRGRAVALPLGPRPCNPGRLPAHCRRRIDGSGDGWFRGEPREADASSL